MNDITMPDKTFLRQKILAEVMRDHGVTRSELLGNDRHLGVITARKDAARRLLNAGFPAVRVGEILNRSRWTILTYFNQQSQRIKRDRIRLDKMLDALPEDVQAIIRSVAKAEQVHPYTIVKEWLSERALCEAQAKARAA